MIQAPFSRPDESFAKVVAVGWKCPATTIVEAAQKVMSMRDALAPPREVIPWLIQGGMGIAISDWRLARAVSRTGQLGVVSGTAIDNVFVRRLQDRGVDEELRSVLERFPVASIVEAGAIASRSGGSVWAVNSWLIAP